MIDGKTSGQHPFSGTIGKSLETWENFAVIRFVAIPVALSGIAGKYLNAEQKIFYISKAVSSGEDL